MAATMTVEGAKSLGWGGWTVGAAPVQAPSRRRMGAALSLVIGASLVGALVGRLRAEERKTQAQDSAIAGLQAAASSASLLRAQAQALAADRLEKLAQAEARAQAAEMKLAGVQRKIEALAGTGLLEELSDAAEAERLGIARALGHAANMMPPDDQRRLLAAIVRAARKNGLDPLLVASVIHVESRFDPYAVSYVGARGLMQLMPATAGDLVPGRRPMKPGVLFNPIVNVELGASYLKKLMDRFDGDLHRALIAYNAGPGVARALKPQSKAWRRLQAYPQAVIAEYRRLTLAREESERRIAVR